jgi:hypothetical protein
MEYSVFLNRLIVTDIKTVMMGQMRILICVEV